MKIFVFADESGVFDKKHNTYFAFGGLIFLNTEDKDNYSRMYLSLERKICCNSSSLAPGQEAKACYLSLKEKRKLFSYLNYVEKFGTVIDQSRCFDRIFDCKKSKQRYLDYAFKISLKRKLENLIHSGQIIPEEVKELTVFFDEHSTATNGRYELAEALEGEFKNGTFNYSYDMFYPPLFKNLQRVHVIYSNSEKVPLIRAADIVANRVFFETTTHCKTLCDHPNLDIIHLP